MRFFSYDSKFGQLLLKLAYSCCLNVLWFICCLPIVTIGASTTALYFTSFKIAKNEGSFITSMFFRSFKRNFKQATVLWLVMLATGIFLGLDGWIVWHLRAAETGSMAVLWTLLLAAIIAGGILYAIVLTYVFPLLSIADNTNAAMIKNAFLIGTHYLFCTILVFAVHYAMFFLVVNVFTPLIIFGEGLCAVISAHLLLKVFTPYVYDPNADMKDPFEHEGENFDALISPGPSQAAQAAAVEEEDEDGGEDILASRYNAMLRSFDEAQRDETGSKTDSEAGNEAGSEGDGKTGQEAGGEAGADRPAGDGA